MIFTVRIIFSVVLRKCYKITVPHNDFDLKYPYKFWRTFFLRVFLLKTVVDKSGHAAIIRVVSSYQITVVWSITDCEIKKKS